MSHRAISPDPAASLLVGNTHRPVTATRQRSVDLVASPRLRGGWRTDADQALRLVWRFEPAA